MYPPRARTQFRRRSGECCPECRAMATLSRVCVECLKASEPAAASLHLDSADRDRTRDHPSDSVDHEDQQMWRVQQECQDGRGQCHRGGHLNDPLIRRLEARLPKADTSQSHREGVDKSKHNPTGGWQHGIDRCDQHASSQKDPYEQGQSAGNTLPVRLQLLAFPPCRARVATPQSRRQRERGDPEEPGTRLARTGGLSKGEARTHRRRRPDC